MTVGRNLSPFEVEEQIGGLCDEMEDEVHRYALLEEDAANAEAEFKQVWARAFTTAASMVEGTNGRPPAAAHLEAAADLAANDKLRVWKIKEGARKASKEALNSLHARLDAMRTLSANLRNQT